MIMINKIFEKNIQFSKYGRSGVIVLTKSKKIAKELEKAGWNCYLKDETYRLNPPTLNLVDVVDIEKSLQYQNLIFNHALYKYIQILNKKKVLNEYFLKVIETHKIFFKDFAFHLSIGPILKYAVKIEGSDNRIYKFKTYLIEYILKDECFIKLYNKFIPLFTKLPNIEQEHIKRENIKLQENYIEQYEANNYKCKYKSFKIDFTQIELKKFDYIIFILNGCFKIIPYFDLDKYKNKIISWKVHMDETKGSNKFSNLEKLKNKFVLIIDSIYSGKTMIYTKKILKNITNKINILGVFPKSDSVANICDYIIVLNKVIKKTADGFDIEKEIIKILGGKVEKE